MLPAVDLVLRVMSDLTVAAAVDHSLASTALLKLYLACRLVKLVELAAGVGASDEIPGQLHVHPVVCSQGNLRHSSAMFETKLDEEVYERALTGRSGVGVVQAVEQCDPRGEILPRLS